MHLPLKGVTINCKTGARIAFQDSVESINRFSLKIDGAMFGCPVPGPVRKQKYYLFIQMVKKISLWIYKDMKKRHGKDHFQKK